MTIRITDERRSQVIDLLRVYIGVALFIKGVSFLGNLEGLLTTMDRARVPAASVALAHYVALAHLGGGLMLAVGLATRFAAAVQVPVVLGAVLFVHRQEGFFTPGQTLELAMLVLFVLVQLVVVGGGPLSVDHLLHRTPPPETHPHPV